MSGPDQKAVSALPDAVSRRPWYQLESRHKALLPGRASVIVAVAAVAASGLIDDMSTRDRGLAIAMCAVALALHVVLWWAPLRWHRRLLAAVDVALVVDALLVLGVAVVSGGRESLALWLLPITTLAATLALSVRTGVKAALLAAIVVGAVQAIDREGSAEATAGPLLLAVAMVVVAGTLARVNERELVQRGMRMSILHAASVAFVGVDDPAELTHIAADAARSLLPGWDVDIPLDGVAMPEEVWRDRDTARVAIPVTAGERGAPDRAFGAIQAHRSAPRVGSVRVRNDQLLALRTLAVALSGALSHSELVQRLEHLSLADPLTGLGNRRAFDDALAAELARGQRTGAAVGLLLIDVDHFKRFNDRHGHQAGDDALMSVARVLQEEARIEDRACRVGGEEFAVLLPGADEAAAMVVAERIRCGVERAPAQEQVTVSLGVASATGGEEPEGLFAQADARLYAAKEAGRNRVVGISPTR